MNPSTHESSPKHTPPRNPFFEGSSAASSRESGGEQEKSKDVRRPAAWGSIRGWVAVGLLVAALAHAGPIPEAYAQRVADAIYIAEGGAKAKVPYGILSVKVKDTAEARRVCLNTIRNNWLRWEAAGRQGDYLTYLASKYCPISADPIGHRNWLRNVNKLLKG